jgi:hypothetical protein
MASDDESYANIRQEGFLGKYIGKRLVDITQHDEDEYQQTQKAYVLLMFEEGMWIKFPVGDDGFIRGTGPVVDPEEEPEEE